MDDSRIPLGFACGVSALTGALATLMLCITFGPHPKEQALKADLKAEQHARAVETAGAKVSADIGVKAEAQAVQIRTVTKEVVRYVPQILTPDVDRQYPLPNGFVSLHDAAITGDLSTLGGTPGEPDDAPSDVAASEAAIVIAANYGACSENAARLTALQDWVRAQQTIMNGGRK